jgi:hypothetical protein
MVMRRAIRLLAICIPVVNGAEPTCPWLNAATAGGVLEGPVHATVEKNGEDATCEFARQTPAEKLRIEVVTMDASRGALAAYKARCAAPVAPLKAIGTDAVACGIETRNGETAEQVAGRVRTQAFLIRVSVSAGATLSRETLRKKAIQVAEQVAGNLF